MKRGKSRALRVSSTHFNISRMTPLTSRRDGQDYLCASKLQPSRKSKKKTALHKRNAP